LFENDIFWYRETVITRIALIAPVAAHASRIVKTSIEPPQMRTDNIELTILMPCLNEAETVEVCVKKALDFLARANIRGEVLIADNGSNDGSQALATGAGARVVAIPQRGYGAALIGGISAAKGRYIIMGDADDSYDFSRLDAFIVALRAGDALVMGDRFAGGIMRGAMPPLHRYLGNPVLSFIGRLLFRSPIADFHCGLRGFSREAMLGLNLRSPGMEFASEMIVKATLAKLKISAVPTILHPDGRSRPPHLRSWRDGWRHLRFLLMMSPRWLLLYPGLALTFVGIAAMSIVAAGPIVINNIGFDIHTMLYAAGGLIMGLQLVIFSIIARGIGCIKATLPLTPNFRVFLDVFTLERGIIVGLSIALIGLSLAIYSVQIWLSAQFSVLDPKQMMRVAIPSVTMMIAGAEIVFASFVLSFVDAGAEQHASPLGRGE
jgi:glycosyltransferase involved in cell wall biosynthesis